MYDQYIVKEKTTQGKKEKSVFASRSDLKTTVFSPARKRHCDVAGAPFLPFPPFSFFDSSPTSLSLSDILFALEEETCRQWSSDQIRCSSWISGVDVRLERRRWIGGRLLELRVLSDSNFPLPEPSRRGRVV